jgi:membrane associated rhomboid family serine protease
MTVAVPSREEGAAVPPPVTAAEAAALGADDVPARLGSGTRGLGAYLVLYPGSRVTTWIAPVFLIRVPAWIYLGLWFLYQLIEADSGLFNAQANGGGVAFFAHVGGFIFGVLITRLLVRARQGTPQARYAGSPL